MTLEVSTKRGDRRGRSPHDTDDGDSKQCPHPRCNRYIDARLFCCSLHWQRLPLDVRQQAVTVESARCREEISDSEAAYLTRELYALIGFVVEPHEDPATVHYGANCPTCGKACFGALPPKLGPYASRPKLLLVPDGDGSFVVHGGRAVAVEGQTLPKALCRMEVHQCVRLAKPGDPPRRSIRCTV